MLQSINLKDKLVYLIIKTDRVTVVCFRKNTNEIPNCITSGVLGVLPNTLGMLQATGFENYFRFW